MSYPRQLVSSLSDQVETPLKNYYSIEKSKYFEKYEKFNDIVHDTLWDYLKTETEPSSLKTILSLQIKMRNQKKERWINALLSNSKKYPLTDKKNPFYLIYRNYNELSGEDFYKLYHETDIQTAVSKIKENINDWKEDSNAYLIHFSFLSLKTKHQIVSSYCMDLIINLIHIIIDSLNGNMKSYFLKKPDVLLHSPFFAPNRFSISFSLSEVGSYVADLFNSKDEEFVIRMIVPYIQEEPLEEHKKFRVFDALDNKIFMKLIESIKRDFYESRTVVIEIGTIAKLINEHPNKQCYINAKTRLNNMALISFQYYKKGMLNEPMGTFNLLDSVKMPDREHMVVRFGENLFDAITKQKMTAVTSKNYNSLKLPISQLIYHSLQKERITLFASINADENGVFCKVYDYSFFVRTILFQKKKKSHNISLIVDTLQEFVDKKIALKNFNYNEKEGLFYLYYFDLTEDEKKDLLIDVTNDTEKFMI